MIPARRAAALLSASVAAKLVLACLIAADGGGAGLVGWSLPLAMAGDVLLVCALHLAVDTALARVWRPLANGACALLVAYVAFNVPVARTLTTPLTVGFLLAAGGAIGDSVGRELTVSNVVAMLTVCAAGGLGWVYGPRALSVRRALGLGALGAAIVLLAPGRALPPLGRAAMAQPLFAMADSIAARVARPRGDDPGPAPFAERVEAVGGDAARVALRGKSVVWIVMESTAARHLAAWGAADDATPNLTAFLRDALVVESAYAVHPESIKGFYAEICADEPVPQRPAEAHAEPTRPCRSIAKALADAGYRTALFHSGWFQYLGMQRVIDGRGFDVTRDAGDLPGKRTSFGADDHALVAAVLEHVDRVKGGPFFAMVLPIAGHHPYRAPGDGPRPRDERTELDAYRNDLQQGDHALGLLFDGLRARGLLDDLLVVVSGDHGEAFREHPGNVAHSLFLYEENVRVPLAFRGRGLSGRTKRLASVVDVAPSILDLVDVAAPPAWTGRSLFRDGVAMPVFYVDQTAYSVGLRRGKDKLVVDVRAGRAELYDLDADPGETRDVSRAREAEVAAWRDWLVRHFQRSR